MPGTIVIGAPSTIAEEGARKKLWWDYDLIVKRVLGRLPSPWTDATWARVTDITLGALATSRRIYLGAAGYGVFEHPYIRAQREQGLVAVLGSTGRPRHGLIQQQMLAIQRDLVAAAVHLDVPVLDALSDVQGWLKTVESPHDEVRQRRRRREPAPDGAGLRDAQAHPRAV